MKMKAKVTNRTSKRATGASSAAARQAGLNLFRIAWKGIRKGFLYQDRLVGFDQLEHMFDDQITSVEVAAEFIEAMLALLGDPFTRISSPSEANFNRRGGVKAFGGVGAVLRILGDGKFIIGKITEGGAAHRAGLKRNAVVVAIDGKSAKKIAALELGAMVRGKVGSKVSLTVMQDGEKQTFVMRRQSVATPSVQYRVLDNGVGYIRIANFDNKNLGKDLQKAALALSDCLNVVVDLRGNRGGSNDLAVAAMALMLDKGPLVTWDSTLQKINRTDIILHPRSVETVTRKHRRVIRHRVSRPKQALNPKARISVLIDGDTASNGEILAAVLEHHRNALLVGETTFGKAVSQVVYKLPGGYRLAFTFCKMLTSTSQWLGDGHENRVGVHPHKVVVGKGRIYNSSYKRDKQLQAACAHLLAA